MKTTRRYGLAAIVKLTSFLSYLSPLSIETRAAIKDMQVKFGMPADSWPRRISWPGSGAADGVQVDRFGLSKHADLFAAHELFAVCLHCAAMKT